jgi:hypothetical protein
MRGSRRGTRLSARPLPEHSPIRPSRDANGHACDLDELIPECSTTSHLELCGNARVPEVWGQFLSEGPRLAGSQERRELIEAGLPEPAHDLRQRAIRLDPIMVVRNAWRTIVQSEQRSPRAVINRVIALISETHEADDPCVMKVRESFSDVALSKARGCSDDFAGKPGSANREQHADHFGTDSDSEHAAESERKVDGRRKARHLRLVRWSRRRTHETVARERRVEISHETHMVGKEWSALSWAERGAFHRPAFRTTHGGSPIKRRVDEGTVGRARTKAAKPVRAHQRLVEREPVEDLVEESWVPCVRSRA